MKDRQQFKIESEEELMEAYGHFKDDWTIVYTIKEELEIFRYRSIYRYVTMTDSKVYLGYRSDSYEEIPNPFRENPEPKYLVTTESLFAAPDGMMYKVVWGRMAIDYEGDFQYTIGSGNGQVQVGMIEARLRCDNPPEADTIWIAEEL